ncbi:hypothetical protein Aperf_G00000107080 [Anoplocephala perfoliata]
MRNTLGYLLYYKGDVIISKNYKYILTGQVFSFIRARLVKLATFVPAFIQRILDEAEAPATEADEQFVRDDLESDL